MSNSNIIKKRPFSGPTEFFSETDKGPNSEKLKYSEPNKYFLAVQTAEGHATEDVYVLHSQAINEKPLQPWLIIEQIGSVKSAHCTCMAGLGEACSHIWSTSVLCRAPCQVSTIDISRFKKFRSEVWPIC